MVKNFQANKDPNVLIKESDKYLWHVEQSRVDIHPRDPRNIRTTTRIAIYRDKDFRRIFETEKWYKNSKIKIKTLKPACLIAGQVRIVHDPHLQKQMDAEASEFVKKMAAGKKETADANIADAKKMAEDVKAENERLKAQLAEMQAKVDDDLGQGADTRGEGSDDTGTAKRPRRKKN
jgi:protein tyrosine/serine phosphatase